MTDFFCLVVHKFIPHWPPHPKQNILRVKGEHSVEFWNTLQVWNVNKKLAPETDLQNTLINSYNNVKQDISMMIPISVFKLYTRIRGIFLFPYKFTLLSYFECTYLRKLKQLSVGLSCYISIRRVKFDRDHIYKSFPRDWKFNSYRKISSAASGKLR